MLFEDMLRFLENNVTPVKLQTYKELLPFLHQLNPSNLEFSLQQFISFNDDNLVIDNLDQFTLFLLDSLIEIIESFGVYISDDQPVADKVPLFTKLAIALYRIDRYEDLLGIKYLMDTAHEPREVIADLLVLMDNRLIPEDILIMVSEISPSLISSIKALLSDLDYQIEDDQQSINVESVERVKSALIFYGVEKAVRYFKDGGKVGDDVELILDYFFSEENKRSLEEEAKIFLISAYIANIPTEDIRATLSEKIPYYITEVDYLLKVSRAVTKLPLMGENK